MSTAKTPWTRAEHSLLLRAWQEVVQENGSGNGDGGLKAATGARVYHRFTELTKGTNKRTPNATYLQKAVLSFNFNFILHYNLTHGVNAWVSLGPEEREQVYNREKTTSYYFVDLDPSMIATMASIRKRLANSGGGAAGISKKRGPKAKVPRRVGNAKQACRAITNAKCSDDEEENEDDEEDEEGESSSSCASSEYESDSSVDQAVKKRKKKATSKERHMSDKSMRVDRSAMVELLDLFKRGARRMEKLLLTDNQRYRRNQKRVRREGASSVARKKDERWKVKESTRPDLRK